MEDITEDESVDIAEESYKILKKNKVVLIPYEVLKNIINDGYIRKIRMHKKWFVSNISDGIVEKME